jgi:hypothetical protein
MKNVPERFPHCDPRFYPYLEKVLIRLPQAVRDDIVDRSDAQIIADDGFREACMLQRRFAAPLQTLIYLNTKVLSGPEHLILLAIAAGLAFYAAGSDKEAVDSPEAEVLLRKWGFTEELVAVRFDQDLAQTNSYRVGYDWARRQNKDYLSKHFGLYRDVWNRKGWGKPSERQVAAIDLPEDTLSKLHEMMGSAGAADEQVRLQTTGGAIEPRQAILAGILTALNELEWFERNPLPVCEIRTL